MNPLPFEEQDTVTWIGDATVRPVGSTGKVRGIEAGRILVGWGYDRDRPRDEQPDAERWEYPSDLLPGFVREEVAEVVKAAFDALVEVMEVDKGFHEDEWIEWANRTLPLMHAAGRMRSVVGYS